MLDNDFELLKKPGVIGFFNSCEVTTIFLCNKEKKSVSNFFTIAVFEELHEFIDQTHFLTDNPIPIAPNLSFGIIQYRCNIEQITTIFYELLEKNHWKYDGNNLELGKLTKISKQFIKSDGSITPPINSILKNNYYNGSYIIEFFDLQKTIIKSCLLNKTKDICEKIKSIIPLDLHFLSDRIGNIIFQFPCNLLEMEVTSTEQWDGLNVKLVWDERIKNKSDFTLQSLSEYDEIVNSFGHIDGLSKSRYQIITGNSNLINKVNLINVKNDIILSSSEVGFIKYFNVSMGSSTKYSESRTFTLLVEHGTEISETLQTVSQSPISNKRDLTYIDWIQQRKYDNEKDELERKLEFIQYGKKTNDRKKALNDIRNLINTHCEDDIYLWDPYLTYRDIMDTLYFCKVNGIIMKAITSFDKKRKKIYQHDAPSQDEPLELGDWFKIQREGFENKSNNIGINLEFRCQHGNFGWKFHDRFLIFTSRNGRPKVWSLGISVNGLGKEHHILQSVSNPQNIIDAFLELWENLNNEECIIWRSR